MVSLIIIVPAYNELPNLKKILKKNKKLFFVIDDSSNDNTETFLKNNKISYVRNKKKLGYEESLLKGMKFIIKNYKEKKIICTVDGDNEHPTSAINKILRFFLKKNYDILICNRKIKNRFLENCLSILFNKKYQIKDPMSGMKFYKIHSLKKIINFSDNKFFLVDLIYLAIKNKFKIGNYEITTKRNLKNSKIGFGFKIQLKILKAFKFLI
jgi:cellulose synthase/poly-beta-1,6-N-acetylglucosamine synthase-like glycosyltransferase